MVVSIFPYLKIRIPIAFFFVPTFVFLFFISELKDVVFCLTLIILEVFPKLFKRLLKFLVLIKPF